MKLLDTSLPDVIPARGSRPERKGSGEVAGKLNIKSRHVVYTSPSGRFTVERLNPGNYPQFKDDLVRIAKKMPDTGPVEAVGDYVNSLVRKSRKAGFISSMSDTSDFIVRIDGKVVGYRLAAPMTRGPKAGQNLSLLTIGVDPRYKGLGVGSALYWIAANEAVRRGLPGMRAQSQYGNDEANNILSRMGFETQNLPTDYEALVTGCITYRWKAKTEDVLKKAGEVAGEKIDAGEKRNWRPKRPGRTILRGLG
ncbi:MAG: GNAT family N-acetyltransferase [Candidatus Altiarchaeota archaeon]|nr:GNAT family N-acetyltransferase [Candidatus Altiarchaeota archaeon]